METQIFSIKKPKEDNKLDNYVKQYNHKTNCNCKIYKNNLFYYKKHVCVDKKRQKLNNFD